MNHLVSFLAITVILAQSYAAVLNVAAVPSVDSAGLFVAMHEGLFKRQGLTIRYTPALSSDTVIDAQVKGRYDITAGIARGLLGLASPSLNRRMPS